MSSHSAFSWKHPRRGLTGGVTSPIRYQMPPNRHGRRARKLAWQRFYNATMRNLPARLPMWCGPKPLPQGPSASVPKPNPKPEQQPVNHGGTAR